MNTDKIRGNFRLSLRKDLKMQIKVTAFAQEPLSFYIHKNRHLFPKIDANKEGDNSMIAHKVLSAYRT